MSALAIGVAACAIWAAGALVVQVIGTRAFGPRTFFAPAARPAWRGIAYLLGPGLSPHAKESVRERPEVYALGAAYHVGIFAAIALLAAAATGLSPGATVVRGAGLVCLAGSIAGVALLVRRALSRPLRAISRPDDFLANALATSLAGLAYVETRAPGAAPVFLAAGMLLLLYVPIGKIRHCVFFFMSRMHAGAFFGRRGVLPPAARAGRKARSCSSSAT